MAIAIPSGFPDATNTGPTGTLTPYTGTLHITTDGAVLSGLDIRGEVIIDADNVTIQNCKITSGGFNAIRVMDGSTGFVLMDSELDGTGSAHNGVFGNGTFLRNDIHGFENGLAPLGDSLIQDNYIHGMAGDSSSHYDSIEINGGSNIQIIHNTIINEQGQTSAIMLDTWAGSLSNITVDGNFLVGGGFTVYLDGRFAGGTVDDASIRITNNQIISGYYGAFAFYDDHPVQYGNVVNGVLTGGNPVPAPTTATTGHTFWGTASDDVLPTMGQSNDGNDTLYGLDGNDVLSGGAGADKIDGGSGTDTSSYAASKAAVTVNLQSGTGLGGDAAGDTLMNIENLMGSDFGDKLTGSSAANTLNGGLGGDILIGLAGNDTYVVDNADDVVDESVSGSGGYDTVRSYLSVNLADSAHFKGAIESVVLTGTGNTNATGNTLNNLLIGNAGNNTLDGGTGADILRGLGGNDTYVVDNANDVVDESVSGSGGYDTVRSYLSVNLADSAHFKGAIESVVLTGTGNTNATGNTLNNLLIGNAGNNTLDGGTGADILRGLGGNDTYVVDNANDVVDESVSGSGGYDTVRSYLSINLADSAHFKGAIESVVLTGTGNTNATGNTLNNLLIGNAGNNVLNGGAGNDTLTGGAGNDAFVFNTALGATNRDVISDFSNVSGNNDTIYLDNAIFSRIGGDGGLKAAYFKVDTATDANDYIIYNHATGGLFYDVDGSGSHAAIQFATLANKPVLTAADFQVI